MGGHLNLFTMARVNICFLCFSLIFGNIYSHFELAQNDTITATERTRLFIGLSGAALLGTLSLFALRKKRAVDSEDLVNLNARSVICRTHNFCLQFYI